MADVFAYLYGFGAGGDFTKSVIIVTAPTGSTVTCTKGTTVKTATEKNGEWWFKNLDTGTWTVKATLSGQTATQTVNITQFDVYRVTMSYFKSTIKVTYPAGSTCTCSKDGEVLTAPNTSGSYTFTVTSAGTWTVKITASGKETTSKNVEITGSGQSVSVEIAHELLLYENGDQCTDITGGWEVKITYEGDYFNATFESNQIRIETLNSTGSVQTKSTVSRKTFTTLFANTSVSGATGAEFHMEYGGSKLRVPYGSNTVQLDISNVNNQVVKFTHADGTANDGTLIIKRVYMR